MDNAPIVLRFINFTNFMLTDIDLSVNISYTANKKIGIETSA